MSASTTMPSAAVTVPETNALFATSTVFTDTAAPTAAEPPSVARPSATALPSTLLPERTVSKPPALTLTPTGTSARASLSTMSMAMAAATLTLLPSLPPDVSDVLAVALFCVPEPLAPLLCARLLPALRLPSPSDWAVVLSL